MKSRLLLSTINAIFVLLAVATGTAQQGPTEVFSLHSGDRVVFYGDSITAQRFYTRDVEEFVLTRYPGMSIEFFNAGVSGDTVYGGYTGETEKRLERDVYPLSPTMVAVMLGMNDPGYVPFDQHIFDVFQTGYRSLIGDLAKTLPQSRLTLIASSPYDEITHDTDFPGLSGTVQKYGMYVKQFASDRHAIFADFRAPLDSALQAAMRANPSYAALLIPDRIHPSESGHWIMAEQLMRAWHASPEVSHIELDAETGAVSVSRNADVSQVQHAPGKISWTALEHALPLPFSTDHPLVQFTIRVANLDSMDQQILLVRGLEAERYSLQIDGKPVANLTRNELKIGINLAMIPTPMLDQANGLDWLEERKTKIDAARFALEGEMPETPGAADAVKILLEAEKAITREQREKAQPKPHTFALVGITAQK